MKSYNGQEFSSKDLLEFLEYSNDLVQTVTPEGRFLYVNRAWKETLGYSDQEIGRLNVFDIIAENCQEKCRQLFKELMTGGRVTHIETVFKAKDGRLVFVEGSCNCRFENGVPVSTSAIFRDVTDRKRAEEEREKLKRKLDRARFFESLGVMAGGIAHDYNNILMSILGNLELLRLKAESQDQVLAISKKIEASAVRAADLTKQILAFSGASDVYWEVLDLTTLIRQMQSYLESMLHDNIVLELDLQEDLPPMQMDKSHISQAIINIFSNAKEAIGDKKGTIKIKTGTISVKQGFFEDAVMVDSPETGPYCYVEIEDNGRGIKQAIAEKVFEPFYSTKFPGRGLGLSAALGIVRGHRGVMKLHSNPNKGTRIRMFFPLFSEEINSNMLPSKEAAA